MWHRSIGALLGLRVILVANIVLLTVLGVLFLMSYERPVAFVFAGLAWLAALVLVNFVRFTDPSAAARQAPWLSQRPYELTEDRGNTLTAEAVGHP